MAKETAEERENNRLAAELTAWLKRNNAQLVRSVVFIEGQLQPTFMASIQTTNPKFRGNRNG